LHNANHRANHFARADNDVDQNTKSGNQDREKRKADQPTTKTTRKAKQ
jgi:hypothetical protein